MKTKEELNSLIAEVEILNKKLHELTEDELAEVCGGIELTDALEPIMDLFKNELSIIEPAEEDPHVAESQQGIIDPCKTEPPKIDTHIINIKPKEYRSNLH